MKCFYHPAAESQACCHACTKYLCMECSHQIKGKFYCQDCLVRGAELISTVKGTDAPASSPKRAALCALIPGIGAVYNNEYLKALSYFGVFAALVIMGDRFNEVFGFGAFVFLIFTMFDAYRTAAARARTGLRTDLAADERAEDRAAVGWGVLLIVLGVLFLLQNIVPYYLLNRLWPLLFVAVGVYLVYRSLRGQKSGRRDPTDILPEKGDSHWGGELR